MNYCYNTWAQQNFKHIASKRIEINYSNFNVNNCWMPYPKTEHFICIVSINITLHNFIMLTWVYKLFSRCTPYYLFGFIILNNVRNVFPYSWSIHIFLRVWVVTGWSSLQGKLVEQVWFIFKLTNLVIFEKVVW